MHITYLLTSFGVPDQADLEEGLNYAELVVSNLSDDIKSWLKDKMFKIHPWLYRVKSWMYNMQISLRTCSIQINRCQNSNRMARLHRHHTWFKMI